MKKPVVDYRDFRLSKLNEPRFSHLKLLLGWLGYFAAYFLTEAFIPVERCHVVHSPLDDQIPFCEWFVIPYVFWYVLIVGSLLWFMLYNVDSFRRLQTYLIVTQVVATAAYILVPTCQMLRPEEFPRDNLLTDMVALLYSADTNTNVCPSLHCAYSIGIASVWGKTEGVPRRVKVSVAGLAVVICLSTAFIKQHSVLDFAAALPVCLLAEWLVFHPKSPINRRKAGGEFRFSLD